jgi:hypothetical protein
MFQSLYLALNDKYFAGKIPIEAATPSREGLMELSKAQLSFQAVIVALCGIICLRVHSVCNERA